MTVPLPIAAIVAAEPSFTRSERIDAWNTLSVGKSAQPPTPRRAPGVTYVLAWVGAGVDVGCGGCGAPPEPACSASVAGVHDTSTARAVVATPASTVRRAPRVLDRRDGTAVEFVVGSLMVQSGGDVPSEGVPPVA